MNLNLGTTEPKFLALAKTSITNAKQNPTIVNALEPFGYGLKKLDEGLSIQNTSETLWYNQTKEKQESTLASLTYNDTFDEAKALISRHRDQARILYKRKPEVLIELQVRAVDYQATTPNFYPYTPVFIPILKTIQHCNQRLFY